MQVKNTNTAPQTAQEALDAYADTYDRIGRFIDSTDSFQKRAIAIAHRKHVLYMMLALKMEVFKEAHQPENQ